MSVNVARKLLVVAGILTSFVVVGCSSSPMVRTTSKPSESKRQYLGLRKLALMPFNVVAGEKGAEDQIADILITELNLNDTFEEVEDPRYVANVLKGLKIRKLDTLDLETVNKLGTEMNAQAILLGNVNAWGMGLGGTEAAMHVSITLTLIDTTTGKPIWVGTGAHRASFSWARVFGLNEGPTDLEVGRKLVRSLIKDMDKEISAKRKVELVRIKEEEAAKLKSAAEAEKRRLEEQMKLELQEGK